MADVVPVLVKVSKKLVVPDAVSTSTLRDGETVAAHHLVVHARLVDTFGPVEMDEDVAEPLHPRVADVADRAGVETGSTGVIDVDRCAEIGRDGGDGPGGGHRDRAQAGGRAQGGDDGPGDQAPGRNEWHGGLSCSSIGTSKFYVSRVTVRGLFMAREVAVWGARRTIVRSDAVPGQSRGLTPRGSVV